METKEQFEVMDVIAQPEDLQHGTQTEVLAKPFGATGVMEEVESEQFAPGRFASCTLTGVPADDIGNETGPRK